jgi:hypothetical protein
MVAGEWKDGELQKTIEQAAAIVESTVNWADRVSHRSSNLSGEEDPIAVMEEVKSEMAEAETADER